jgi:tetratricopeptide (TPR) repeat protein
LNSSKDDEANVQHGHPVRIRARDKRNASRGPHYAPAWARLGRIYRVLAKYGRAEEDENLKRAESAFTRALEINPDLSIAHNLYAYLEVDLGRARDAMLRLVDRGRQRSGDPELFAGLVHACRYCGLLDASSAAYEQAIGLDPKISTSAGHTFFMLGHYEKVFTTNVESSPYIRNIALVSSSPARQGQRWATRWACGRSPLTDR